MAHVTELASKMALDRDFFENVHRQFPDIERLDFREIMSMDHDSLSRIVFERTAAWRQGINEKLKRYGFYELYNDHEDQHVWSVKEKTEKLLHHADATDDQIRCGIIIALLHDVGNRIHRDNHSVYSALSLSKVFTNYDPKDSRFQTIAAGILLHDPVYGANMRGLDAVNDILYPGETPADERKIDPIPIAAVIAADKADIGRRRTPLKILQLHNGPLDIHTVLQNPHTIASLFVEDAQLVPIHDSRNTTREVVLDLHFSNIPDHDEEEIRKGLERFLWRSGGHGMRISKEHYSLYRDHNLTYAAVLQSLIRRLYSQELAMCQDALGILFPDMQKFTVRMTDKTGKIADTDQHSTTYGKHWKDEFRREWKQPQKSSGKKPSFYMNPPIVRSVSFISQNNRRFIEENDPDFPEEAVIYQIYQNIMNNI